MVSTSDSWLTGRRVLLGSGLRVEMAELGSGLRVEMADLRTTMERGLRTNMMWTITTMIAGFAVVAAVTALAR